MTIVDKLWKKAKLVGKEVKDSKVLEKIGEIAEESTQNLQQQKDVVKSALNERKVGIVLKLFDKLGINDKEIEKLTEKEINTICQGMKEKTRNNWGYNTDECFVLDKEKVATWGEYNIYVTKIVRTKCAAYRSNKNENSLLFENYIIATNKDGRIVGINYFKDDNYDINNIGVNTLDSILGVFNTTYIFQDENINNICWENFMLSDAFASYGTVTLLTKEGKKIDLCIANSNTANKHYTVNTQYLRANDKIIKNSLQKISRNYRILLDGTLEPQNNWQLCSMDGELKGVKKEGEQSVYANKKYYEDYEPSFDSTKNYGDISLYAQKNEDDEYVIDAEDENRRCDWKWKKIALSTQNATKILELTVFEKVRKQEIINSMGEREEIHFYDKNGKELEAELEFDKNRIQYEQERDREHIGHCTL